MIWSPAEAKPELQPRPVAVLALDGFELPDSLGEEAIIGSFRDARD